MEQRRRRPLPPRGGDALRALAQKNGYKLAYNREILALGIANFVGAAFGSYTTTGSFSRSAINNSCGAKTQLAGFITGVLGRLPPPPPHPARRAWLSGRLKREAALSGCLGLQFPGFGARDVRDVPLSSAGAHVCLPWRRLKAPDPPPCGGGHGACLQASLSCLSCCS